MARKNKSSGFQWIGEIPRNWGITKLKYILLKSDSGVWGKNPEKGKNNKIVLRSTEQTVDGHWRIKNPAIRNLEDLNLEGLKIEPNDLLITKSSGSHEHIGKTTIADSSFDGKEIYYSNFLQRIRISKDNNAKFIWYILNSAIAREQFVYLQNSTSGLGNINKKHINNIYVPIPDLKEQTNIVNYLDDKISKINKLIQLNRKSIEAQKSYKQSLITETVTKGLDSNVPMKDSGIDGIGFYPNNWALTKLKYLISLDPSFKDEESNPEYSTFVPMDHLKQGYFINGNMVKTKDVANSYSFFAEGDIAIAKVRPSFENGNIALMNNLKTGIGFGTSEIFVLRIESNRIINKYLLYYLMNENFINITSSTMTGVAGLKRYSSSFLMNYPIPLPPLNEQKEIIDYLDKKTAQIDKLIEDKTKLIEELEKYKQSLIYEYVTGKKEV